MSARSSALEPPAEHDFDDGGVPDALGLFAAPAVSGLGE